MKPSDRMRQVIMDFNAYHSSKLDLAPYEFQTQVIRAIGAEDYFHAALVIYKLLEMREKLITASNNLEEAKYLLKPFEDLCREAYE
jgi:hypothetical protein